MTTPAGRWARTKALFDDVAGLPAAEREARIAVAGLDAAAQAELRSLLQHHDAATGSAHFLAEAASAALPVSAARAGQLLGAWEIVRPMGSGGMGEVFEVRRADGSFEGRAAVKLLKRGMDSAAVLERFAQERQALARLSHPNIARLLDAGVSEDGLPYFVMEHVDGQRIDSAVRGLGLPARLQLFLQLARAVAHAHRNLLVHRDLKPGNVLVDADGQVKLLDFGIAKALDPLDGSAGAPGEAAATLAGERPYTPQYASPEQVRGQPVSTATDIYSLGVLLYEMLTGTRPTGRRATTPAAAARSVLEDAPTRPSRLTADDVPDAGWLATRKTLEGDLDNILLKSLEKPVERRYASVDAMAADIEAHLSGHPVSARAATTGYRAAKFVGRNRIPVALAALAVVALAGGLIGTAWQWQQAERARAAEAARFAQVRAQANRLLFDYHDAILLLPGATPLAARILADARDYLASLADGAGDNPALLRELGVAYRRLGDLTSSPGRATLGDLRGGLALQRQGVALLTRALALQPGSTEGVYQLALAQAALGETLREQGDAQAALLPLQASAAAFDLLAQTAPAKVEHAVEQVRSRLRLNAVFGGTGGASLAQPARADALLAEAGTLVLRLRATWPDDLDVTALFATTQNSRYLAASRDGRWAEGLALLQSLDPVFASMLAREPDNTLHARDAAVNRLSQGTALGQLGRYAEARDMSADALARMQRIAAADPANRNARRDVARLQTDVGWAHLQLGQPALARPVLTAATTALEALAAADPADRRVAGMLAIAHATLAQAAAGTAAVQRATGRALTVAATLVAAAPADRSALRTLALVHQQSAAAWAGQARGQATACTHWRAARDAWLALQDSGRLYRADAPRLQAARQGAAACPG